MGNVSWRSQSEGIWLVLFSFHSQCISVEHDDVIPLFGFGSIVTVLRLSFIANSMSFVFP